MPTSVLKVDFNNSDAITYDNVREKANKKLCSFINFASKDSIRMGTCCHEASHACDAIEDAIGMEHFADDMEYIMANIHKTNDKKVKSYMAFVEEINAQCEKLGY